MNVRRWGSKVSVLVLFIAGCCLGAEVVSPPPEAAFQAQVPEAYKDYEILPGSLSPDTHLALLNPKREVYLGDGKFDGHLYVVSLSPFKIVATFPKDFILVRANHADFGYEWAKDGSALLVTEYSKWGVGTVYVVAVPSFKMVDLTTKVRQHLQKDYEASKAAPYNDNFDFLFYGENATVKDWSFSDKSEVIVNCVCTTDPKGMERDRWTARFQGVWNIRKAAFSKAGFERLARDWEYQKKQP